MTEQVGSSAGRTSSSRSICIARSTAARTATARARRVPAAARTARSTPGGPAPRRWPGTRRHQLGGQRRTNDLGAIGPADGERGRSRIWVPPQSQQRARAGSPAACRRRGRARCGCGRAQRAQPTGAARARCARLQSVRPVPGRPPRSPGTTPLMSASVPITPRAGQGPVGVARPRRWLAASPSCRRTRPPHRANVERARTARGGRGGRVVCTVTAPSTTGPGSGASAASMTNGHRIVVCQNAGQQTLSFGGWTTRPTTGWSTGTRSALCRHTGSATASTWAIPSPCG